MEYVDLSEELFQNHTDYYGFIYITTDITNGKRYVGKRTIDARMVWKGYLGSGAILKRHIKGKGKNNFKREVLQLVHSEEELHLAELEWISKFNAVQDVNFYNVIDCGDFGNAVSFINGMPVVCIDNGLVFRSKSEASKWSGHSIKEINWTFYMKYDMNSPKKCYIFRPLHYTINHKCTCKCCGKNSESDYCEKCVKHENFEEFIEYKDERNHNNEVKNYTLDEYLKLNTRLMKMTFSEYNKRRKIKVIENNVIDLVNQLKPKKRIRKTEVKLPRKINRKVIDVDIELLKHLYLIDMESISYVSKILNISSEDVKKILKQENIPVRPSEYMNYYSNHNEYYGCIRNSFNEIVFIFKYFFEVKYWYKMNMSAKISTSYLRSKIENSHVESDGIRFQKLTETEFHNYSEYYKTIDLI